MFIFVTMEMEKLLSRSLCLASHQCIHRDTRFHICIGHVHVDYNQLLYVSNCFSLRTACACLPFNNHDESQFLMQCFTALHLATSQMEYYVI